MDSLIAGRKSIKIHKLINYLNKVNFQGGFILVNFKHPKYDQILSIKAIPQPCNSPQLECVWLKKTDFSHEISTCRFINFSLDDGFSLVQVGAEIQDIGENGIKVVLNENGIQITRRQVKRTLSRDVDVQLIQDSIVYKGKLLDFSSLSFTVDVFIELYQSADWINPDFDVFVIFQKNTEVLYSGKCQILREVDSYYKKNLLLKPLKSKFHRFKPKKVRSIRQTVSPPLNIVFEHPFTGQNVNLNIVDLSGTGLSVDENPQTSLLLPGMIIPELGIKLTGSSVLKCKTQVMFSNKQDNSTLRCGFAILDMQPQDHITLINLLYRAEDQNSHFSSNGVDLDALWDFFFETGFVYPNKYAHMESEKAELKKLYNKLYTENPDFARNIIYQDKGKILGHVSMMRYYEKTWVIQHHAAITSLGNRAGFVVMQLIGRYTNEFHRLRRSNMNFVACYYRPQSRFPDKTFGAVTRKMDNPKKCSLDSFAYYNVNKISDQPTLPEDLVIELSSQNDLIELGRHYDHTSGGLMIDAMNLKSSMADYESTINQEYQRLGYKRHQLCYSLKKNNKLKAVFITLSSDVGLNMSDLSNCIHVIIIDGEAINQETLDYSFNLLTKKHYEDKPVTVLLNPIQFADDLQIEYEKVYNLWIIDIEYGDFYFQHIESLFNRRNIRPHHNEHS